MPNHTEFSPVGGEAKRRCSIHVAVAGQLHDELARCGIPHFDRVVVGGRGNPFAVRADGAGVRPSSLVCECVKDSAGLFIPQSSGLIVGQRQDEACVGDGPDPLIAKSVSESGLICVPDDSSQIG